MIVALWCALGFLALVVLWLLSQNDQRLRENEDLMVENQDLWRNITELGNWNNGLLSRVNRQDVVIQFHQQAAGGFWTTGIGTKLRIRDMSDCHLRNAIAWCEQHGKDATDLRAERKLRRRNKRMEAQQ